MLAGSKLMPRLGRFTSFRNASKHRGGFLAGFEREGLAMGGGMVADAAHHIANGAGNRDLGRFGNKTNVGGDTRRTDNGGEIAYGEGSAFAFFARGRRHEADGALHGWDIGVALAVVGGENGENAEMQPLARASRHCGAQAQIQVAR